MLHEALSGRRLTKLEYQHELPKLQDRLLDAQFELRKSAARADAPDWRRAYEEINEFERQFVEHAVVVAKFWMSVSPAEQLVRFAERDRKLWKPYQVAARDMLALTNTPHAPWTIVPADDKRHARLAVLRGMCERIEAAL
jgi:polyphosphate kinase 2 (PPK2 family)